MGVGQGTCSRSVFLRYFGAGWPRQAPPSRQEHPGQGTQGAANCGAGSQQVNFW